MIFMDIYPLTGNGFPYHGFSIDINPLTGKIAYKCLYSNIFHFKVETYF